MLIPLMDTQYAMSGVPLIVDGRDGKWIAEAQPEGWGADNMRATWHTAIACKKSEPDYIYALGFQTTSANMLSTGESWKLFSKYGFESMLKLDGGGSFIFKVDSMLNQTTEDRQISTIGVVEL